VEKACLIDLAIEETSLSEPMKERCLSKEDVIAHFQELTHTKLCA
jgi:hypothetical protein